MIKHTRKTRKLKQTIGKYRSYSAYRYMPVATFDILFTNLLSKLYYARYQQVSKKLLPETLTRADTLRCKLRPNSCS